MTPLGRRDFLSAMLTLPIAGCVPRPLPVKSPYASAIPHRDAGTLVNDVHSQLNATRVAGIAKPRDVTELRATIAAATASRQSVSIAGGRHAMGGQQFGEANLLVDTRDMNRVLDFDADKGTITVEGGIQWPQLLEHLGATQAGRERQWGIYQKQTGADRLSIAGALSCNAHGRGLTLAPMVQQVEQFDLLDARGVLRTCSRQENAELFGLAIGGYGLFGFITRVQLRLRPRVKVRRVVELGETSGIMKRFDDRIRDGYLYGDFQFTTDAGRDSFLRRGIFACYEPVTLETPLSANPTRFQPEDWARLTFYSHKYKRRAYAVYSSRYLATSGQNLLGRLAVVGCICRQLSS